VFTARHLEPREEIISDPCADSETEPAEFNGRTNQVHLPVNLPPKAAPSKLVNSLNGHVLPPATAAIPRPGPASLAPAVARILLHRTGRPAPISVPRTYIQQQDRPT
jgi:putative transposase